MILHVWNIIFSEFLLFSFHSSCWILDAKFERNVGLSKVRFD